MNQTKRAIQASQTMLAVPLDDGSTWTGTEVQLRRDHPDWIPYAQIVQPRAQATRTAQVLPSKEYNPAELARQARHRAREEARQRSRPAAHTNAGIPNDYEEDDDADIDGNGDVWPPRLPNSAMRYAVDTNGQPIPGVYKQGNITHRYHGDLPLGQIAIPPRRSASAQQPPAQQYEGETEGIDELVTERTRPKRGHTRNMHFHPLVCLGLGMIAMIFLWVAGSSVINWWQIHQDDSAYGRPRTYQTNAVVGHGDSSSNPSHFIAVNLNRHVIVIELPGGDPTKARIYPVTTLFGDGQDLTPVTLSFKDVTGNGLLDMEIHIQDQTLVMINENGAFRPLKAGERVHL